MPDAPAPTPVLSTTRTSSPRSARCQAVESPWTPAPMTSTETDGGTVGATGTSKASGWGEGLLLLAAVAYRAMLLPLGDGAKLAGKPGVFKRSNARGPASAGPRAPRHLAVRSGHGRCELGLVGHRRSRLADLQRQPVLDLAPVDVEQD